LQFTGLRRGDGADTAERIQIPEFPLMTLELSRHFHVSSGFEQASS